MNAKFSMLALAFTALSACDPAHKGTGVTPGEKTTVTMNFCDGFPITWMAIQNTGEQWQEVNPDANGLATFQATEKVSIAFAFAFFGSSLTQVIQTTAEELDGQSGLGCDTPAAFGNATVTGSVTGVSGSDHVTISAAAGFASADVDFPSWELTDLPDQGTVDLVATRFATMFTQPANRVIVRRGVVPNTAITPLNFATAPTLEGATVTFANVGNASVTLDMDFWTVNGTIHNLGSLEAFSGPFAFNYVSVPASLRIASDVHALSAYASTATTDRIIAHAYKTPAAKTLTFGPELTVPTITQAATTPFLRLTLTLPVQSEYPTAVTADYSQSVGDFGVRLVSITQTASFSSSPPTQNWVLTIPDFAGAGYDTQWGLTNSAYNWDVAALNGGGISLFGGGLPADGTTVTAGLRFSGNGFSVAQQSTVRSQPRTLLSKVRARGR